MTRLQIDPWGTGHERMCRESSGSKHRKTCSAYSSGWIEFKVFLGSEVPQNPLGGGQEAHCEGERSIRLFDVSDVDSSTTTG